MKDSKTKVLLLDDEKFLLFVYERTFDNHGYDASSFSDGDTALASLRNGYDPDVILFDITMPDGISGYEFIETVRREHLAPHSLRIALTNEGQEAEISRMRELGADAHLLKSKYTPAELVSEVEKLLEARKA